MQTAGLLLCWVALFTPWSAQEQNRGPDQMLDRVGLKAEEIREILAGVEQSAYDTPESWSAELRAVRVDLGASPGIVLRGTTLLCGATGNCQLFVFRQTRGHWVPMFDGQAPIVESFRFGPDVSHGIKDLSVTMNMSAEAGQHLTYEFDGRVYRATRKKAAAERPPHGG